MENIDNEIDIFLLSKTNLITYLRFTLHWTFGQDSWEHAIKASLPCVPYGTHPTSNGLKMILQSGDELTNGRTLVVVMSLSRDEAETCPGQELGLGAALAKDGDSRVGFSQMEV